MTLIGRRVVALSQSRAFRTGSNKRHTKPS